MMYYKKNDIYLNIYQRLLREQEYNIGQVIKLPGDGDDTSKKIYRIKKNNLILDIILKLFEIDDKDIKAFYTNSQLDVKEEQKKKIADQNLISKILTDFVKTCQTATDDKDGTKIIDATKNVKKEIARTFPKWSVLQWFLINWLNGNILDKFVDEILNNNNNFTAIKGSSFFIPNKNVVRTDAGSNLVKLLNGNPLKKEQTVDLTKSLLKNNIEDSEKSGVWDWIVDGFDNIMGTLFPGEMGQKFSDSIKDYTKNLNLVMGRKKNDPTVVDEFFKELQKNPDKITGAEALKHVMVLSAKGQKPSQELLDKATKEFQDGLSKQANLNTHQKEKIEAKSEETDDSESARIKDIEDYVNGG